MHVLNVSSVTLPNVSVTNMFSSHGNEFIMETNFTLLMLLIQCQYKSTSLFFKFFLGLLL